MEEEDGVRAAMRRRLRPRTSAAAAAEGSPRTSGSTQPGGVLVQSQSATPEQQQQHQQQHQQHQHQHQQHHQHQHQLMSLLSSLAAGAPQQFSGPAVPAGGVQSGLLMAAPTAVNGGGAGGGVAATLQRLLGALGGWSRREGGSRRVVHVA